MSEEASTEAAPAAEAAEEMVPKSVMLARLKAKDERVGALSEELTRAQETLATLTASAEQAEQLRKDLEASRAEAARDRSTFERARLLMGEGLQDEAIQRRVSAMYEADTIGQEEAATFADWWAAAKSEEGGDPVIRAILTPSTSTAGRMPKTGNATPPPTETRKSRQAIRAERAKALQAGDLVRARELLGELVRAK